MIIQATGLSWLFLSGLATEAKEFLSLFDKCEEDDGI
jgi:hypothetical protein